MAIHKESTNLNQYFNLDVYSSLHLSVDPSVTLQHTVSILTWLFQSKQYLNFIPNFFDSEKPGDSPILFSAKIICTKTIIDIRYPPMWQ